MNLCPLSWPRKIVLAALIMATVVGIVWSGLRIFRPRPPAEAPTEAMKSNHPPIVALRDQLLQHYHGNTSKVFVQSPGFGHFRLPPLYKKISFRIPYLSPTEIEVKKAPQAVGPLKAVLRESMAAFQSRPLAKMKDEEMEAFVPPSFVGLQLRRLDLVGLTDRQNPKVYSGGAAFELVETSNAGLLDDVVTDEAGVPEDPQKKPMKTTKIHGHDVVVEPDPEPEPDIRSLDFFEQAGVGELRKGAATFVRRKGNVIRMLGALRAEAGCIKCHKGASKGDLLGAFSYTFFEYKIEDPAEEMGK